MEIQLPFAGKQEKQSLKDQFLIFVDPSFLKWEVRDISRHIWTDNNSIA